VPYGDRIADAPRRLLLSARASVSARLTQMIDTIRRGANAHESHTDTVLGALGSRVIRLPTLPINRVSRVRGPLAR